MPDRISRSLLAFALTIAALLAGAGSASAAAGTPINRAFAERYGTGTDSSAARHIDRPEDLDVHLVQEVKRNTFASMAPAAVATEYLPTSWCGEQLTVDDTAHATSTADARYKLVYAYASDQPNRFDVWKDPLQADVSLIGQYLSQQGGRDRVPRWDMGTSCGPEYVDIQVVRLPGPRSNYMDDLTAISDDVTAALGSTTAPRNLMILADGLTDSPANSFYGLGETYTSSDRPDAANPHNGGNLTAALFPPLGYVPPTSAASSSWYPGFWPEGMLHELTHTLGAVISSAPHSSRTAGTGAGRGHCTDGYDLMCYQDGPLATAEVPYTTTSCPRVAGQGGMTQTYDCGRDDYFNPSPAAGSYLATHWNVYNNRFQAPCATEGKACGIAVDQPPPVNAVAPAVSGVPRRGRVLTATSGTWTGATSKAWTWQRETGGVWADIPGAATSAPTYTLVAADVGHSVRIVETATNAGGPATSVSSGVGPVTSAVPANDGAAPSISGSPRRTRTLTASPGGWSDSPTSYQYQWQRRPAGGSFTDIAAANDATYVLTSDDIGGTIRVQVAATNVDGTAAPVASPASATVTDQLLPVVSSLPAVAGEPRIDGVLTATTGTWTNAPTAYRFQWQRSNDASGFTDIPSATGSVYRLVASDVGRRLRVLVVAVNADGDSAAEPSAATVVIAGPASSTGSAEQQPTVVSTVKEQIPITGSETTKPPVVLDAVLKLKRGKQTILKLPVRTSVLGSSATVAVSAIKVKLKTGRYTLRLCKGKVCVTKTVVAKGGKAKLPAIQIAAPASGRLTATLADKRCGARRTGACRPAR